jgi:hypothetical protein
MARLPATKPGQSKRTPGSLTAPPAKTLFCAICVICGHNQNLQKSVAKRNKLIPFKHESRKNPLRQKATKTPYFCEGVRFEKKSPSTISREMKIPFAKTGEKAAISAERSRRRQLEFPVDAMGVDREARIATVNRKGGCNG